MHPFVFFMLVVNKAVYSV